MAIVAPRNLHESRLLLAFLGQRGVVVPDSTELRLLAHVGSRGDILGVVAYNHFIGKTCTMHAAGVDGQCLSRKFLYAMFHFPFVVCDCAEIILTIPVDNFRSFRLCKRLGFEVVHRIRHGWKPNVDLAIMRMPRHGCRWLSQTEKRELQAA